MSALLSRLHHFCASLRVRWALSRCRKKHLADHEVYGIGYHHEYVRCARCGAHFTQPRS